MPNKNKKRFLNEKVFPFGKGIVFGLGILAIGLVTAQVDINFANFSSGGLVTADNFNRLVDVLCGIHNDEGNIGIGTEEGDITEKLQVGGNMLVTGNLTASNLNAGADVTINGSLKGINTGLCDEGQAMNGFVDNEISCVDLPTDQPYVRLLANGDNNTTEINYNNQVVLTWTNFGVDEEGCFMDGGEFSFVAVDPDDEEGIQTTNLTSNTNYTLLCTRADGQMMSDTVEVVITGGQMPTVSLEVTGANPIGFNGSTTLSWASENADTCQINCYGDCDQDWVDSLNNATNGTNVQTESLIENTTYSIYCNGDGGMSNTAYVDIEVEGLGASIMVNWGEEYLIGQGGEVPTITSFTVDDNEIIAGESTNIRWNSDGGSCLINNGADVYQQSGTGSMSTGNLDSNVNFTIVCLNENYNPPTGSEEESLFITVLSPQVELIATPEVVDDWTWEGYNISGQAQIHWEVRDMLSCYGDDFGHLEIAEDGTGSGILPIEYVYTRMDQNMPDYIDYAINCRDTDQQEVIETVRINLSPTINFRAVDHTGYEDGYPYLGWMAFGGTCTMTEGGGSPVAVDNNYWGYWSEATPMGLGEHSYELECSNANGNVSVTDSILAVEKPVITNFSLSPISIRSGRQTTISWNTENILTGSCRAYWGGNDYEQNLPDNANEREQTVTFDAYDQHKDFYLLCDGLAGRYDGGIFGAKVRICNDSYDGNLCGESCYGLDCIIGE